MHGKNPGMNRRQFIRAGSGIALVAVGATVLVRNRAAGQAANPFAYDVQRLEKTDPKLVGYQQVKRFSAANPRPRRIALGPEGHLYAAGTKGVTVFSEEQALVSEVPLAEAARCVAVAADGTIYAGLRSCVVVLDPKGQLVKTWQSPGPRTWLTGLAVGENDVFAADSGSRVILRYDRSGKLVGRIGEKNKARNVPGLIVPSPYLDVALGRDGLLRVNNPGRHRIETYTLEGDLELSWGKPSFAIEGFCGCCNPISVALLPDGSCITCEKGLPRAKVYSADGAFECVIAGPESFPENGRAGSVHDTSDGTLGGLDAAAGANGEVYVLDLVTGDIDVMKKKA